MRGFLVGAVLAVHGVLLLDASRKDYVTVDEVGHIAAGISHWRGGTFALYRVNPPLPRMVAVLPVLVAKPNCEGILYDAAPGVRPEFVSGRLFADDNSNRYMEFVFLARLSGILWSAAGALILFQWARELYGYGAGLFALALWCFEPNILAHAHLVTPDVPATVAGLATVFVFWRYLRSPSAASAWLVGLVLGVALLTKFTSLILYPVLFAIWLIDRFWRFRTGGRLPRLATQLRQGLLIVTVSVMVLNLGYEFSGSFKRLDRIQFISQTFAGPLDRSVESGNRFAGSILGRLPMPVPEEYLRGIDAQRLDFELRLRSYLAGTWQRGGWWYYYLYALCVKVPIALLALIVLNFAMMAIGRFSGHKISSNEFWFWLPAIAILAIVSSQTGFSHHLRYVLPIFPFVIMGIAKWGALRRENWRVGLAALVLLAWTIVCTVTIHPHYLSYFNAIGGGPDHGHKHLLDSNIDWGQDLLYLKKWLDSHPEARPLRLAYHNVLSPNELQVEFELPSKEPLPGYFAVSINFVRGAAYFAPDGRGNLGFVMPNDYEFFQRFEPIAKAGYSIFIYHISRDEADRVRREMNLPPLSGASP